MASKRFSIEGVVSMVNKVSGPMGAAGRSVNGFSRKMQTQFRGVNKTVATMNKGVNKIGRMGTRALFPLTIGAGLVTRQFIQFDDAIFSATARFKAAEKTGTDMTKVMENLRMAARKTGSETQFTATQAALGLDKFALAGFTSKESINSLRSVIDLATATGEDFARVSDISSDLLGAFGFAALNSVNKVKKLKEMNAQLAIATVSANVTMEDLFETLKIVAPIGKTVGASMSDMIATTALLGSSGIKGSLAATAMKNIFTRLIKPTKDVTSGLNQIGLSTKSFVDQSGKLKPMSKIFGLIGEKTKGLTDVAKGQVFAKIFGARAFAGAANIQRNVKGISETLIKLGKDPQKQLGELAGFMRKSLGNQLKILGSALTEVGFKIISAFAGKGKKGIANLTKSVQEFNPKPIVNALKAIGSVLGMVLSIISFVAPAIKFLGPVILGLVIAIKAWILVQSILNILLIANPVGGMITMIKIVVLAIGALIGLIIALVKNWDEVKKSLGDNTWGKGLLFIIDLISLALDNISRKIDLVGKLLSGDITGAQRIALTTGITGQVTKAEAKKRGLTVEQFLSGQKTVAPTAREGRGFVSPVSRSIENTSTINQNRTTNSNVGINVNAPKGTGIDVKGTLPPGITLNRGTENI